MIFCQWDFFCLHPLNCEILHCLRAIFACLIEASHSALFALLSLHVDRESFDQFAELVGELLVFARHLSVLSPPSCAVATACWHWQRLEWMQGFSNRFQVIVYLGETFIDGTALDGLLLDGEVALAWLVAKVDDFRIELCDARRQVLQLLFQLLPKLFIVNCGCKSLSEQRHLQVLLFHADFKWVAASRASYVGRSAISLAKHVVGHSRKINWLD